jgi:hypothetical protein
MALVLAFLFQGAIGADALSEKHLEEIPAQEILEKIKEGEPINYDNVTIIGDLNLSQLGLGTKYIERTPYEAVYLSLSEKACIVPVPIKISNSIILGDLYFNNTIFYGTVVFNETKFNGNASFAGSEFKGSAYFGESSFNKHASFAGSKFYQNANPWNLAVSSQGNNVFSHYAISEAKQFQRSQEFWVAKQLKSTNVVSSGASRFPTLSSASQAHIARGINSNYTALFLNPGVEIWLYGFLHSAAVFDRSKFNGTATFDNSEFNGAVIFDDSQFNDTATFENSKFKGPATFFDSKFRDTVNFGQTEFREIADFSKSEFNNLGKLVVLNSTMPKNQSSSNRTPTYIDYVDHVKGSRSLWFWDSQIAADFWGSKFYGPSIFFDTKFNGSAFFRKAQFQKEAIFASSEFKGIAYFGGSEFNGSTIFAGSEFNETNNFTSSDLKIPDPAYIQYYDISRPPDVWFWNRHLTASFWRSRFNGTTDFSGSKFNGPSDFELSKFQDGIDFESAEFKGPANFANTEFRKEIGFNDVWFNGDISFYRFDGDAFFINSKFSNVLNLNITKYNNLFLRWKDVNELSFDDTAYLLLIENFKKLGFFDDANDCYYTYRIEGRQYLSSYYQIFDFIFWALYGYGMKPQFTMFWFVIIIIGFGFIFYLTKSIHEIQERPDSYCAMKKPSNSISRQNRNLSLLESINFSATVFLLGANIYAYDSNKIIVSRTIRYMITLERLLGLCLIGLIVIALANTVIR